MTNYYNIGNNKYKLNYLRRLTQGVIPDKILKNVDENSITIDRDGNLKFSFKAKLNTKKWKCIYGTVK